MEFLKFIQQLSTSLETLSSSTSLQLTIGNESCDLDSIVCSLAYAYFLSSHSNEATTTSLPLLNCKREDLVLRQDAVWLFEQLEIDIDRLIFLDDISKESLDKVGQLSITLVDHNSPRGLFEEYRSKVKRVIDHHKVGNDTVQGDGVESIIDTAVGSCSTLVAEQLLQKGDFDQKVATLLLSAILIDTGDLKATGRFTERDVKVFEQLCQHMPSSFDRVEHYRKLFEQHFDISKLSTLQVLRKDFKSFKNKYTLGFSSITALLSEFLKRPNVLKDMSDFYRDRGLDALLLLGMFVSDPEGTERRRQIAIFEPQSENASVSSPHLVESLASVLEANEDLKCERAGFGEEFHGILLEQGNVEISRKHIMPIVIEFVASVETDTEEIVSKEPTTKEESSPAAVLGVSSQEHPVPLEPTITVLESKPESVHMGYKGAESSKGEVGKIPEYSVEQESEEMRKHRYINVGGEEMTIDMDLIQPYRKIIQHAGYIGQNRQALVVISACYLPPHSLPNYSDVIHHLFFYIMSMLDKLVVDNYIIIYLHSGAPAHSMPSIRIFHKFYKMVDRRLRKQLVNLFIVHPTFWVKTMIRLARPIISRKFWRKVHFIPTLQDLHAHIAIDDDLIAAPVLAVDSAIMAKHPAWKRYQTEEQPEPGKKEAAASKDTTTPPEGEAEGTKKNGTE